MWSSVKSTSCVVEKRDVLKICDLDDYAKVALWLTTQRLQESLAAEAMIGSVIRCCLKSRPAIRQKAIPAV